MANSITVKLAFQDTNETRLMTFENLPDDALDLDHIKNTINAINASLQAGTSGGLNEFFLSNDGNNFSGIIAAHTVSEEETPITIPN